MAVSYKRGITSFLSGPRTARVGLVAAEREGNTSKCPQDFHLKMAQANVEASLDCLTCAIFAPRFYRVHPSQSNLSYEVGWFKWYGMPFATAQALTRWTTFSCTSTHPNIQPPTPKSEALKANL